MSRPAVPLRPAFAALAAAVAVLLLYFATLTNGFAYDDVAVIGADPRVHELDVGGILTNGYWLDEGHGLYRPLTTLSFALDWSLAPDNPTWFHFGNTILHAGVAALVALLLARLWTPAGALLGGLLFAVHPVHVEAVANVVGRAELLAAVFFLGCCLLWLYRGTGSRGHGTGRAHSNANRNENGAGDGDGDGEGLHARNAHAAAGSTLIFADQREARTSSALRALRQGAVPVIFALAVFSKESAIMLPALLPLLDVAAGELRRGHSRSYIARNGVAYVLLAVVALSYIVVRAAVLGDAGAPERLDPSVEVLDGAGARVLTALQAWPVYVRLLLVPVTLLADYGPRILGPAEVVDADVALGAAILLAVVVGGVLALARGHRRTALALLWFPIAILPVSNLLLPIGVLVAERTLYLPSVALCFGVAALGERWPLLAPRPRRLAAAAAVLVLSLFGARSLVRIPEWDSTDRIMLALVRDRPDAFRGQWHLARLAQARGDNQAALERYAQAIELWPYRRRLVFEVIGFASRVQRLDYAAELSAFAVGQWPGNVDARRFLAATTLDRGDTLAARRYLEEGLHLAPNDPGMVQMREAIGLKPASGTESR